MSRHAAVARLSVVALVLAGAGCETAQKGDRPPVVTPAVAPITHVVLTRLSDHWEAKAMIDDARRSLSTIPGVVSFSVGEHVDTGRANVAGDYDVGMVITFNGTKDYARYVDHPWHQEFVARWKPRIADLRIFDVGDSAR